MLADVIDRITGGFGAIGLQSSDEFMPPATELDRMLIDTAGPRVAVLLSADPRAAPRSARYAKHHFESLGAEAIPLDVLRREQATADALPEFDILYIAGGSPATLLECLRGTPLWDEALRRWAGGATLAGSSAGAMALCRHCLVPAPGADKPTTWGEGLGPLERVGLAVHASSRPDKWIREIATAAPVPVVALADGAGILLRPGADPATTGRVWVVA